MAYEKIILAVLVCIVLGAGCVPTSVNPLYFKKDLIVDPELIGTWGNPNNLQGTRLIFTRGDSSSYTMAYYESKKETGEPGSFAQFEAHLIRLGDNLFLDIYPRIPQDLNQFYMMHFVPTHSFARIDIAGDTLKIGLFDLSWLNDNLENGTVKVPHEYSEGQVVLTASTEELQKFVTKHADVAFPYDSAYQQMRLY